MIDLRSDTVTRPTPEMRAVMAAAEVGDDVYGEDPTVNRLEEHAAEMLNKEAGLFLPTGTMANLVAFLSQTRPGETVVMSEAAHPFHYERANVAMVGGLLTRVIPDLFGKFTAEQLQEQLVLEDDPHLSPTTLASIENTTNRGGGAYWEYHELEEVARLCRRHKLRLHCDGARLFNACIAANMEARFFAQCCDTVCFCLSKGLGAPAGSLLVGEKALIHRARHYRKMLGGGMRQAGVLAAAGLYALQHHVDDLAEDHRRARAFRRALENEGIRFTLPSPTNMLYLHAPDPDAAVRRLAEHGVLALSHGACQLRAVFHRDIDDNALQQAIEAFKRVLAAPGKESHTG